MITRYLNFSFLKFRFFKITNSYEKRKLISLLSNTHFILQRNLLKAKSARVPTYLDRSQVYKQI